MSKTKEIQIIRRESKSYLPTEIVANAKHRIGSVLKNQAPLSGLDDEQTKKYLPKFMGVSETSPDFETKVRTFWADYFINVPKDGTLLNISLGEDGEPVNLKDWIDYQWILRHPLVAENIQEFNQNPNMRFYIHDRDIELRKKSKATDLRREASKEWIKLTTGKIDGDKVDRVIRILTGANPYRMNDMEKNTYLEGVKDDNPTRFIEVVTDKDLDVRAEINEMIEAGVLTKIGNSIMFVDDPIGHSMEEAILFMKNPKESTTVSLMRQRAKEANKTATVDA